MLYALIRETCLLSGIRCNMALREYMVNRALVSTVLVNVIVLSVVGVMIVPLSAAGITVGKAGSYKTIQGAVSAAAPGDTISVSPGAYRENVVVDKPLTIKSSNGAAATTITAANPSKDAFLLTGADIRIEGFTITGASGSSGVKLDHASQCAVVNNIVYGNIRGVYCYQTTQSEVSSNNLTSNGYGVYFDHASDNTISNNVAMYERGMPNGSALGDGIFMANSSHNMVVNNVLSNNHVFGISLLSSTNNSIRGNNITANEQFGVRLRQSSDNVLSHNTISKDAQLGVYIGYASGNVIILNNFLQEPSTILNPQNNILNSTQGLVYTYNGATHVSSMGNYYSDYRGADRDGNGIGDTVYPLGDGFPLVKPVEQYGAIKAKSTLSALEQNDTSSTNANSSVGHDNGNSQRGSIATIPRFAGGFTLVGTALAALLLVWRTRTK